MNQAQVRFLVVGGYAVIEHTEPRYTKDLDIWVKADMENAERVYSVLKKFGAPLTNIRVEDFTDPGVVYHMGRPPSRVDVLMGLRGLDFETCWQNRFESNYDDEVVAFLSNEDLVINKKLAGRPQDLMDVENLLLAQKRKNQ